jgi:hypothetical protein
MNPDLYGALHTAGVWLAAHWTGLAAYGLVAAFLTVAAWACWPSGNDYRTRNDRRQAAWTVARNERPEPDQPGTDDELLNACQQICPDLARKEMP